MDRVLGLIESTGDGAFAVDHNQRIVFWNRACEKILGYSTSDVIGKPCYDVIGGTADDGCLICRRNCHYFRERGAEPTPARDLAARHLDGSKVWLNISTIAVPSTWAELSVFVHLVRDATPRKHLEESVRGLVEEFLHLTAQDNGESHRENEVRLTDRESEVIRVLASGSTTREIAETLSISEATVRNHIHNIISKLGVRSRLEAVTLALRDGLL